MCRLCRPHRIDPACRGGGQIRAAAEARQNKDVLIIARTDELEEADAIARAKLYVEAGADLIQPISRCFSDFEGLKQLRKRALCPLLANFGLAGNGFGGGTD